MLTCRHFGWSLDEWHELSNKAKDYHLAYMIKRLESLSRWRNNLASRKMLDPVAGTLLLLEAL